MRDLVAQVLGDVVDVVGVVPLGVVLEHADQLGVDPLLVAHGEHAEDAHPHHAAREGRVGDQHQRVERVAVAGQGLGDEAVVRRIGGGGEEAAVQPDHVLLVVVLVLVAAPGGDLDHDLDDVVGGGAHGGGGGVAAPSVVDRAHDPHPVAVGIADHGVAGAPEGVVGRLLDRHALGGQGGHQGVDLVPRVDLEAEDGPGTAGPATFP